MLALKPPAWLIRPPSSTSSFAGILQSRSRGKLAVLGSITTITILLFITFLATNRHADLIRNTDPVVGKWPYTGPPDPPKEWKPPHPLNPGSGWCPADRMIVKVALGNEDVSWLDKIAWMWRSEVIVLDDMYTHAWPKGRNVDKGRVASAYLKWIIENWGRLPGVLVMLPPDEEFLPPDDDENGKMRNKNKSKQAIEEVVWDEHAFNLDHALRHIQVPFVLKTGFHPLQCPTSKSTTTCNNHVLMSKPSATSYELRTLEAKIPDLWKQLFDEGTPVPISITSVLGSQFVVSKTQLEKRYLNDYLRWYEWIQKTIMDDDSSGLVFEYIWHMIFGKEAVFCPERARCLCDVYGECG